MRQRKIARAFRWLLDSGKDLRDFRGDRDRVKTSSKVSQASVSSATRSIYPDWYDPETYRFEPDKTGSGK